MRAKRRTRSTLRSGVTVTPGVSGATRNWVAPASVVAVTSSWSASAPASTGDFTPVSTKSPPSASAREGDVAQPVVRRRLGGRPGGDDVAGDDRREDLGLVLGRPGTGERRRDDVARQQWARRDVGAEGIRHEGEVGEAVLTDAAAAELLGHQQRHPTQLGALAPVVALEAGRLGTQRRAPSGSGTRCSGTSSSCRGRTPGRRSVRAPSRSSCPRRRKRPSWREFGPRAISGDRCPG